MTVDLEEIRAAPVKHLKLLRPDDTLLLGRVYRLVSFEEVLKEFATKRHVKLSRVMVKVKDEEVPATKPAKPRRRRGSGGAGAGAGVVREESDRSLAKVRSHASPSFRMLTRTCIATTASAQIFL
ncbi:uncharacterized protein [Aegilops tauschii subsp. strangulata]|uniref:uncharacterized protein n=1 Tax=Aegilops tauschii subsp. strangulata TaxID=200361 RepID=UPI00098BC00C|nr:uncharacterized protein LOC123497644 [Aegilops tauschii subsp. strangulata]